MKSADTTRAGRDARAEVNLVHRYRQIGISAVAAALMCQSGNATADAGEREQAGEPREPMRIDEAA